MYPAPPPPAAHAVCTQHLLLIQHLMRESTCGSNDTSNCFLTALGLSPSSCATNSITLPAIVCARRDTCERRSRPHPTGPQLRSSYHSAQGWSVAPGGAVGRYWNGYGSGFRGAPPGSVTARRRTSRAPSLLSRFPSRAKTWPSNASPSSPCSHCLCLVASAAW